MPTKEITGAQKFIPFDSDYISGDSCPGILLAGCAVFTVCSCNGGPYCGGDHWRNSAGSWL